MKPKKRRSQSLQTKAYNIKSNGNDLEKSLLQIKAKRKLNTITIVTKVQH
ncbi:hypothetical protein HYD87_03955 [Mycoplasmopsis bovis]|nr:hypothetical protein [Mycoplasmopsis bovis]QQH36726.1 hypothetical protein HYD87_03955 [Mycoplasmopsis bovis]